MTYTGPGVANNVNPAVTPTVIFSPTPNASATLRVSNNSGYVAYLGGVNVSQFNGFPLPPGNRPVELANCPFTVYSCSPVTNIGQVATTTITSAVNAGHTALTNSGTFSSSFTAAGTIIVLGNTGNQEVLTVVGAPNPATSLTVSTLTLYDHASGVTVSTATMQPVNITATAGVV